MNVFRNRWIQLSALTALIAGIGINALRLKFCVRDSDVCWHLKVGDWIVDHFAAPAYRHPFAHPSRTIHGLPIAGI